MTEDESDRAPERSVGEMTPEEWREERRRIRRQKREAQLERERLFHEERERAWREQHAGSAGRGGPEEGDVGLFPHGERVRINIPQGKLPAPQRPEKKGAVVSASFHMLLILIIVLGPVIARRAMGNPGEPGGGGGGGGGREIQLIDLPPAAASAARAAQEAQAAVPPPEPVEDDIFNFPVPEVVETADADIDAKALEARPEITLESLGLGLGEGTGDGPGRGTGTGGGIGSGEGQGIGSGVGDGTGGDGGDVLAPEPRTVVYPFEEAPDEVRGVEFTVHFWVDRRGRVTKVEITPNIKDSDFRRKLIDRMHQWVFYPARTLRGSPVEGEYIMTVTF